MEPAEPFGDEPGNGAGRVIPSSRRPDGTWRKEIRVRAGYVPQDEVEKYQSKGTGTRRGTDLPPGLSPDEVSKPKSKSAAKNEKRKAKKKEAHEAPNGQAASSSSSAALDEVVRGLVSVQVTEDHRAHAAGLDKTGGVNKAAGMGKAADVGNGGGESKAVGEPARSRQRGQSSPSGVRSGEAGGEPGSGVQAGVEGGGEAGLAAELEKKARALRKKIRQAEALAALATATLTAEQASKVGKLPGWKEELRVLEEQLAAS